MDWRMQYYEKNGNEISNLLACLGNGRFCVCSGRTITFTSRGICSGIKHADNFKGHVMEVDSEGELVWGGEGGPPLLSYLSYGETRYLL